jgi:large subunit ribosomal protein L6
MSIKPEFYLNEIVLPSEVSITKQENLITTKGSFGSVQKDFTKMPAIIDLQDNKITIKSRGNRKKRLCFSKYFTKCYQQHDQRL